MRLHMVKFGKVLNGRPAGREAVLRARNIIGDKHDMNIILDFSEVSVLTPSYADELLSGLKKEYTHSDIQLRNIRNNKVVNDTLMVLGYA